MSPATADKKTKTAPAPEPAEPTAAVLHDEFGDFAADLAPHIRAIAEDPETGKLVPGGLAATTELALAIERAERQHRVWILAARSVAGEPVTDSEVVAALRAAELRPSDWESAIKAIGDRADLLARARKVEAHEKERQKHKAILEDLKKRRAAVIADLDAQVKAADASYRRAQGKLMDASRAQQAASAAPPHLIELRRILGDPANFESPDGAAIAALLDRIPRDDPRRAEIDRMRERIAAETQTSVVPFAHIVGLDDRAGRD